MENGGFNCWPRARQWNCFNSCSRNARPLNGVYVEKMIFAIFLQYWHLCSGVSNNKKIRRATIVPVMRDRLTLSFLLSPLRVTVTVANNRKGRSGDKTSAKVEPVAAMAPRLNTNPFSLYKRGSRLRSALFNLICLEKYSLIFGSHVSGLAHLFIGTGGVSTSLCAGAGHEVRRKLQRFIFCLLLWKFSYAYKCVPPLSFLLLLKLS